MAYPASIDSFGSPSGTSLLTTPDHAADHSNLGVAVINIETTTGTTSGTATLKNITVGKFAVSDNGGTFNNGVIGTAMIRGGTIGTAIIGTSTIQGGTVNDVTIGTPTLVGGTIAVSGTTVPVQPGAALAPSVGTLTDTAGGTLTANAQASQIFYSALGTAAGNRTIGTPANAINGQSLTYAFKTSGSANGTLVWSPIFTFSQDIGTPALGTSTAWHYYAWRYTNIDTKWHFQGQSKNVI